jgi:hypothetical protein
MTRQTSELLRIADYRGEAKARSKPTYFNRSELNQLLGLYSRHVIRGEWRDYAIDHRDGFALFSIFRHAQESAAFSVLKCGSGPRAGEYHLYRGRQRLRTGRSLAEVLELLRRKPTLVTR